MLYWFQVYSKVNQFRSDQIRSVAQSCPTLCDPMNRSTDHHFPEFTETQVHRINDSGYNSQVIHKGDSEQIRSVAQSCPTLSDPMKRSTPGLPVHHQLLEFTQTHVHRVSDAIQPSHPLSSPSPPAPNPSQHQSFPMSQLFA